MSYTNPVDLYQGKPKTKIVCTLGPSSDSEEVLIELIKTGMNVARLNMSHGDKNVHEIVFNRVRKVSKEFPVQCAYPSHSVVPSKTIKSQSIFLFLPLFLMLKR